jgi:hypothetical protein
MQETLVGKLFVILKVGKIVNEESSDVTGVAKYSEEGAYENFLYQFIPRSVFSISQMNYFLLKRIVANSHFALMKCIMPSFQLTRAVKKSPSCAEGLALHVICHHS